MNNEFVKTTIIFKGIVLDYVLPISSLLKLASWFQNPSQPTIIDRVAGWKDNKPVLVGLYLSPNSVQAFTPIEHLDTRDD